MLKAEDIKVGKSYKFYESINGERARHYKIGKALQIFPTYILFEVLPDVSVEGTLGIPIQYRETFLKCDIGMGIHPIVFKEK